MRICSVRPVYLGAAAAVLATANIASASTLHRPTVRDAPYKQCTLPTSDGEAFQTALPEEVGLEADAVNAALLYANTHIRGSVQIFRNGCLAGNGLAGVLTDDLVVQVFSVTKSVVGLLGGLAIADGKLDLDSPIGDYLPQGYGWGDAAHRAITVRQIFTETAGASEAILAEAATVGLDASAIQELLAQNMTHTPGTFFEYSQRVADAAAYIIQSAVGQDLQIYAQARLFGPLGIESSSYFWLRDRSANTYGYAWLFLAPRHLARLGLLMQNQGRYNDRQVVPSSWIAAVAQPSPRNPCYGMLFWNNAGQPCTGANIPVATTVDRVMIQSAPSDLFAMVGALQQNNFAIASLNMTVTWSGFFGDTATNLSQLLSALPADLYYEFFRILMRGVEDVDIPDPGPFQSAPLDLDIDPRNYIDPDVLLRDIDSSPDCNVVWCNGAVPTEGLFDNLEAVLGYRPSLGDIVTGLGGVVGGAL